MKITRIQIDGILGVSTIDVKIKAPITLFCGENYSGKSSIRDNIALAIAQQHARSITLKKNYQEFVHEGLSGGGSVITINDDPDQSYAFNMPEGKFTGAEVSASMRVALDGQLFSSMKSDERRKFLFDLTKCRPNAENVKNRMLDKGCDPLKIDAVLPMLRTGFPNTCEFAKTRATESKGSWRTITGEIYGSKKAESWKSEKPAKPEFTSNSMKLELIELEKQISESNQTMGTIVSEKKTYEENKSKRELLKSSVSKISDLEKQIVLAEKELAEFEPKVINLRNRSKGVARTGLVHDMAKFISECEEDEESTSLMSRYESEHGKLDNGKVDQEAQSSISEYEKSLLVLQNRAKNLKRDLDSSKQAKGQFDALAPDGEMDYQKSIDAVKQFMEEDGIKRAKLVKDISSIDSLINLRNEADEKTKLAKNHHNDVLSWSAVADALAPDGIPSELLIESLKPVNSALEQASLDTDWKKVSIDKDMEITASGRSYHLLSESEQWRTDAMIAQVVSELSGLKIMLLDRVDVLNLQGRKELLEWLDILAQDNLVDTVLLFATLKSMPSGLPETIESFWVKDGEIAGHPKRAVA